MAVVFFLVGRMWRVMDWTGASCQLCQLSPWSGSYELSKNYARAWSTIRNRFSVQGHKAISAHVLCLKEDEFVLMKYKTAAVTTEEVNSAPRIWNHLESRVAGKNWQKFAGKLQWFWSFFKRMERSGGLIWRKSRHTVAEPLFSKDSWEVA